jgi:arabinan endo-1,5-alpha-L-arabinosidase|tara:strand:- start:9767 stop:10909 length:1143 start_codon:yes stop_codon:yes gene_type:complete
MAMFMSKKRFFILILCILLTSGCGANKSDNYIRVHDPTTIRNFDGKYMLFSTTGGSDDKGIKARYYSAEKGIWLAANDVLSEKNTPEWLKSLYPDNREKFWAPDLPFPDRKIMYFSTWSFSGQDGVASIGRAVGTGTTPNIDWVDDGKPVVSTDKYTYDNGGPCAIDPSVFEDYVGHLWLSFGSHGLEGAPGYGGIWIVELDPETGHIPVSADPVWTPKNPAYTHLANYGDTEYTENNVEAPFIYKNNGFYYLFVNWDRCCNGVDSDYRILVGRSKSPIGPYMDKTGKSMFDGGGSLVLESEGRFIGPGHAGIFQDEAGKYCFSFHYYDSEDDGRAKLGLRELVWNDNWPVVTSKTYKLTEFAFETSLPAGLTRPPHDGE